MPNDADELDPSERVESTRDSESTEVTNARHVLLTRAQAARRMGVSIATVRRMEGEELQPVIVDGKHCFELDELDRHRRVTDGDLAAQCFEMFSADKTQVDVVIALKQPPERVRKLFQDWVEMSETIVAGPPGISRRQLQRFLKKPLTRRMVWVCLTIVMRNPALRAKAEREVGYQFG